MIIDINCDLGEGFGKHNFGFDEEILKLVSSANIACGFHAGDPETMERTVSLAIKAGVNIGAHPGLPDLQGFGRRKMDVTPQEVGNMVIYQIGALDAFVKCAGSRLHHVKPHGALYNMAAKDEALARAIVDAVFAYDNQLILYGLSGSCMESAAKEKGLPFASEVFADRGYTPEGTLIPRDQEGAFIHGAENCAVRIAGMVEDGLVEAINGEVVDIKAETICVHGDNAEAVEFVRALRHKLEQMGHIVG